MKNILVLINLSSGAERLAKMAYKIAQQSKANLILCSIYELPVTQNYDVTGTLWKGDDEQALTIERVAEEVIHKYYTFDEAADQPQIICLNQYDFNSDKMKVMIVKYQVSMVVAGIPDLLDLPSADLMYTINQANCPVLVIPDDAAFEGLNTTAYLTDLRYCDTQVISYLKALNTKIYVTHVSMSSIPDMEDGYAQSLLSNAISTKIDYNKLFLRNIKGANRKTDLELVTRTEKVQFFTIVNQKHNFMERFLSDTMESRRSYHNLPLLVIPYLNWHRVA